MDEMFIQAAAIIVAIISGGIAIFQILLFLGFPYGEYSWGGTYGEVLPRRLRMMSLPSAILLLVMGYIFLIHTKVLPTVIDLPTHLLVWVITIFLGLNTLGNLASKSKKEKALMSPLSGIACIAALFVSFFGVY